MEKKYTSKLKRKGMINVDLLIDIIVFFIMHDMVFVLFLLLLGVVFLFSFSALGIVDGACSF